MAALSALRQHKDLFWTLTQHRIRVRYKQSVLGLAWAVVQPQRRALAEGLEGGGAAGAGAGPSPPA